jgi:hypothetical protein
MNTGVHVPAFLRQLPIGAIFTHATAGQMPDSWVKVNELKFRRTYDYRLFEAIDFESWTHVELTEPIPGSIDQEEADRRMDAALRKPPRREMGG